MTEVTPVETSNPVAEKPVNKMEMVIETNTAPGEQKSPEMATTEPKTDLKDLGLETKADAAEAPAEKEPEKPEAKPAGESADDRANKIARDRFQDKIRADNAERELAKLKPSVPTTAPVITDFQTLKEYEDARDTWRDGEVRKQVAQEHRQAEEQRRNDTIRAGIAQKEQQSAAKHPDYYQAVEPVAPIIGQLPILKQFIAERELGTEVAYHLAKNPSMLEQLTRMTPFQAGEFLFGVETRLKAPPVVTQTNAPEPIKPVGSREVVKPKLSELASKDINGYIAKRNKQELARRRAN